MAQGFAIAGRRSPRFDSYCMTGDGELQEGPIWEAVMYAGQKHLDNLCVLVDRNQRTTGPPYPHGLSHAGAGGGVSLPSAGRCTPWTQPNTMACLRRWKSSVTVRAMASRRRSFATAQGLWRVFRFSQRAQGRRSAESLIAQEMPCKRSSARRASRSLRFTASAAGT